MNTTQNIAIAVATTVYDANDGSIGVVVDAADLNTGCDDVIVAHVDPDRTLRSHAAGDLTIVTPVELADEIADDPDLQAHADAMRDFAAIVIDAMTL